MSSRTTRDSTSNQKKPAPADARADAVPEAEKNDPQAGKKKSRGLPELVEQKLESLPTQPGCYLFRDKKGGVLYVGKAKSLRARVKSYFAAGGTDTRAFIPALPRWIGDLETFVTANEKEAAILENSLIKENRPRLNVKLRDDKEYLNLRLDARKKWPRLELVRRPSTDGSRYFGPYHSATAARRTLHLVEKHFQLRTCSDRELKSRQRPCIQYQIQRCPAPCVLDVDQDEYQKQVRAVELFLSGRHDELTKQLDQDMKSASQAMEFELAARYRDQVEAVKQVREQQRVVAVTDCDQDVLGFYREGDLIELSVVYVRHGRVVEIVNISHSRTALPDDEVVAAFLREHYAPGGLGSALIPDEVVLPLLPEGAEGVAEWLTERRSEDASRSGSRRRVQLLAPQRGSRKKLLALAQENAEHAFKEKQRKNEDAERRLDEVRKKLRLPVRPTRIECCDISHLGGEATVGSVVSMVMGEPDKKRYKSYRVRSVSDGDDYAAMYEVLSRRFRRGLSARDDVVPEDAPESDSGWELPDLFVVDGGRGQLAVAQAAAADLGLRDLPLVGLAKERETALGEKLVDRVYLPGQKNPIALRPNTPELFFLARARDEAHRFANLQRKRVGKKRRLTSRLDEVPGIGPKTRKALLGALGSVEAIRDALDEELLSIRGVSRNQVAALREALGQREVSAPTESSVADDGAGQDETDSQPSTSDNDVADAAN